MYIYKFYIIAVKSGSTFLGYVQNILYENLDLELTKDTKFAKVYTTISDANREIAKINRFPSAINNGLSFEIM